MATHISAAKRHRQSLKRRDRNRMIKSSCRTALRKVKDAIIAKDKKTASAMLIEAESTLARAASKGVLHKDNAARRISRAAQSVAAL